MSGERGPQDGVAVSENQSPPRYFLHLLRSVKSSNDLITRAECESLRKAYAFTRTLIPDCTWPGTTPRIWYFPRPIQKNSSSSSAASAMRRMIGKPLPGICSQTSSSTWERRGSFLKRPLGNYQWGRCRPSANLTRNLLQINTCGPLHEPSIVVIRLMFLSFMSQIGI